MHSHTLIHHSPISNDINLLLIFICTQFYVTLRKKLEPKVLIVKRSTFSYFK